MSARRRALEALRATTENGTYANLALKEAQRELDPRDAAWVAAAVYTTLDHIAYIDLAIARYAKGKLDKAIKAVLRLGIAQAMFMDTPHSAACSESVKLAREIGKEALSGYVNAVMRTVCREGMPPLPEDTAERLQIKYGCPAWLVAEYIDSFGAQDAENLLAAKVDGFTVRAQYPYTSKMLETELERRGIKYSRGKLEEEAFILAHGFDVESEPLFTEGKLAVQSESAMLVCRAVTTGLEGNAKILDCCAAPGGKAACIASFTEGAGHIDAWEKHPHRAELLRLTLIRLKVKNASIACRDAGEYDPAYEGAYDAVLIDAPCSGFGVTGKPDIRLFKNDEDVLALVREQARILDAVSRYVKPGGRLVYATCTVSKRENADQTVEFLKKHTDFVPSPEMLPAGIRKRATGVGVQLRQDTDRTDGFYIAVFKRKAE